MFSWETKQNIEEIVYKVGVYEITQIYNCFPKILLLSRWLLVYSDVKIFNLMWLLNSKHVLNFVSICILKISQGSSMT